MKKIAVFYHCLFYRDAELLVEGVEIVREQMEQLRSSGLLDACSELVIGINGGKESDQVANLVIPYGARRVLHGLRSKAENLTLVEIEKWIPAHPDWYVLYFHAKGATHLKGTDYGKFAGRWRKCMMAHLVGDWRKCVAGMDTGFEAVGCHWMTGLGSDKSQNIFAGNFWWATTSFLSTLPSIFKRDRIKVSGIASAESRYEAEVWIGNGPRLPRALDPCGHGVGGCP